MADPNTRQGKRTPVTLKIKFKSETLEQFIERYAVDVSQGGIFIRTKEPLAVGTQMRFEFQLRDASPLIAGEGTVVWTRENDPSRPAIAPGMGVRFDRLAEGSQGVLERILAEKAKQAPQRGQTETTKPPMFTDTPTRVAPAPVQEALLGGESAGNPKRKRPDSFGDQGTPLPRPMPFHSDADEFPEEAFEEATKVRALDELIAQTADSTGGSPGTGLAGVSTSTTTAAVTDELAARRGRADSTLADPPRAETEPARPQPPIDRDSAPGLPSPPETPKAAEAPARATPSSSKPPANEPNPDGLKTKLGMEPAKMPLRPSTPSQPPLTSPAPARPVAKDALTKPTGMRAVAAEPKAPEAPQKSGAPLILLLLLALAVGGAAVWFFVIRPKGDDATTTTQQNNPGSNNPGSGSALATNPGSAGSATPETGSAGSAEPMNGSAGSAVAAGSNGSAGSAAVPAAELVETQITAPGIDKATIEVEGTDQTGPAPLKAKLEKGKAYKARVQAPGYVMKEVDVKGGEKASAKLDAKPRVVTVTSDPPGALIFVDGGATGHSTPFDIELTKAQSARKSVRVGIRKSGFKAIERVIDAGKYTEDADKMITKLDEKLDKQVIVQNPNPGGTGGNTIKTNTGSGSASTATGSAGSGAATPNGAGTGTGSGDQNGGTGETPKPPTGSGTGETPPPADTQKPATPPAGGAEGSASGQSLKDAAPKDPAPKEPEPDFVKKQQP